MLRPLVLVLLALLFHTSYGQERTIVKGVVRDTTSQEAVFYARVYLQGRSDGAYTDEEGRFVLRDVPPGTYTLIVDAMGYETVAMDGIVVRPGDQRVEVRVAPQVLIGGPPVIVAKRIPWPKRWFVK